MDVPTPCPETVFGLRSQGVELATYSIEGQPLEPGNLT
jgi:hypothetical protein